MITQPIQDGCLCEQLATVGEVDDPLPQIGIFDFV